MSLPDNTIDLAYKYVDNAAEAASRSRHVLLALLIASVVTFFSSWNIRDEAWLRARLMVEEDVLRWWSNLRTNQAPSFGDPARIRRFQQARLFFTERLVGGDAVDSARVAEEVEVMRQVRVEDLLTLRMPLFGVVVDLNDLTFVSGVSFAAILMWLSFALSTERRNLQFVFRKAVEWEKLGLCYDLLMMRQVLSRPPGSDEPPKFHLGWRRILLILLPLGVQIYVVYHHLDSLAAAESISHASAATGWTLAWIVTLLVFLLTIRCVVVSIQSDIEWERRARMLRRFRDAERAASPELDLFS
jgi:hypothetical protein